MGWVIFVFVLILIIIGSIAKNASSSAPDEDEEPRRQREYTPRTYDRAPSPSYVKMNLLTKTARKNNSLFIVFDIETTGLNWSQDRIVEIAAVRVHNGAIVDSYQTLINPNMPIPPAATKIHGITNSMVKNAPQISQVIPDFLRYAGSYPLVAHNASFDVSFLQAVTGPLQNPVIDTLSLCRKLYTLPNYKLTTVAQSLRISPSGAHRSLDDANTTALILLDILQQCAVLDAIKMSERSAAKALTK